MAQPRRVSIVVPTRLPCREGFTPRGDGTEGSPAAAFAFCPPVAGVAAAEPVTGAHPCVCTAPRTRRCERLCSHIPQRPRPVQRQPSLGMTWIHFKLAVIHPGLAPGLSAHLPEVLPAPRPLSCGHSWVLGLPGAACSPSLPCCPWSQALPAPSLHCAVVAHSAVGPHRLFQQQAGWLLGAGAMLPQQPWHSHPCTGSPCHSLSRNRGWFCAGSAPRAPAAWITAASPHAVWPQRKHMSRASHTTPMLKPRKSDTAARAGHQHHPSPRDFIPLT